MINIADNPSVRAQLEKAPTALTEPADNRSTIAMRDSSIGRPDAYPAKGLALQNGRYVVVDQPK